MSKATSRLVFSAFVLMLLHLDFSLQAQNIIMRNDSINVCAGLFTDSGDTLGSYSDNENLELIICPGTPGQVVSVNFTTLNILPGDSLCIYNGNSTSSPIFDCYNSLKPPASNTVTASLGNASGCLTFTFFSDDSLQGSGWEADVNCLVPACQSVEAVIDSFNGQAVSNGETVTICHGDSFLLNASALFPENNINYAQTEASSVFTWHFGDGNTMQGQNIEYRFSQAGGYFITLEVSDTNNCVSLNSAFIKVAVSGAPDFSGITFDRYAVCTNDSIHINGSPEVQPIYFEPFLVNNNPIFISQTVFNPDIFDCIDVQQFADGAGVTDPNEIEIFASIAHPSVSDLEIWLTCPNGDTVNLHKRNAAFNTYNFDTTQLTWTMSAQQTLSGWYDVNKVFCNALIVDTCRFANGSYLPDSAFQLLMGCPLNGQWCLHFNDNQFFNDGFLLNWGIRFKGNDLSNREVINYVLDSINWPVDTALQQISSTELLFHSTTEGEYSYTLETVDEFGCRFDTTYVLEVLDIVIEAIEDTSICLNQDTLQMNVAISGDDLPTNNLECGLRGVDCAVIEDTFDIGLAGAYPDIVGSPLRGFWHDGRIQAIYTAQELNALGIESGTFTGLGIYLHHLSSSLPYTGFSIKLGCTSQDNLNTFVPNLQVVVSGFNYQPLSLGLNFFVFNNTFNWDGESNLIVEMCFDKTSPDRSDSVLVFPSHDGVLIGNIADNQIGCVLSSALPNFYSSNQRPAITLTQCPSADFDVDYLWRPSAGLNIDTIPDPLAVPTVTTEYEVEVQFADICAFKDTVVVTVNGFDLEVTPADTIICETDSVQLNASAGDFFTWTPPATLSNASIANPFANPADTQTYFLEASDSFGCTYYDSAFVARNIFFQIPIGADQTICPEDSVILAAPQQYQSYQWSTGSPDSFIVVHDSGLYWAVFNNGVCDFFSDTVMISEYLITNPPIGASDTVSCAGSQVRLFSPGGISDIFWLNDTLQMTDTFSASANGLYFYSFFDGNGCLNRSDSITLSFLALPDASFSIATQEPLCDNEPVVLKADTFIAGLNYQWSTGASDIDSIIVFQSNSYSLVVSGAENCTDSLSVPVSLTASPQVDLNVFSDTTVCCGSSVTLVANSPSTPVFEWNDMSGGSELLIVDSGTYFVIAMNNPGCTDTAFTVVDFYCFDSFDIVSGEDTIELGLTTTLSIPEFAIEDYKPPVWQPFDKVELPNQFETATIPLDETTEYEVTLEHRESGCEIVVYETIHVINESAFVHPNAFTPNNDGHNDQFYPILNGTYGVSQLKIFSRWGELVHDSNQPWDGTNLEGEEMPAGTYVFFSILNRPLRGDEQVTGHITLIR